MANRVRNFEPTAAWSNPDGTLTERAKGWTRSVFDFIGAGTGSVPIGSLGGDGTTTKFLRADGSFAVPSYPVGANPTASVGLSATNGSAATFMRSDAAPPLNQGIAPTWTALHTYSAGIVSTTGVFSGAVTTGTFGCNGQTAQAAASVNAAVAGTAGAAYTATEQGIINDTAALVNQLRAALVANGIAV